MTSLIYRPARVLCFLLVLFGVGRSGVIITFGSNSTEWNHEIGLTGIRMGCSSSPESCVSAAEAVARSQGVGRMFIAIRLDPVTAADYSQRYSRLSLEHGVVNEVDFDDFMGQWLQLRGRLNTAEASAILAEVVGNLKSANRNLRFGITLYEDELADPNNLMFSEGLLLGVDVVHLYLHYRADGAKYEDYVRRAKQWFPKAVVIAGSYAYDRIDYLACASGSDQKCAVKEEIGYFRKSLEIQARLAAEGLVEGIEFYPAMFDREEDWNGWNNRRICLPERREQCIENTRVMRKIVLEVLTGKRATRGESGEDPR